MKQIDLFETGPNMDAGVPLMRVKSAFPRSGGGWACLLECGHEASIPVGPRPRSVPHTCPEDQDERITLPDTA